MHAGGAFGDPPGREPAQKIIGSVNCLTVESPGRWQPAGERNRLARWAHADAPDPLFPSAVRGAQFHAGSKALRHLSAVTDQCHYWAWAAARWRAFPTQTNGRADRARPRHTSLFPAYRRKRGSRAWRRASVGRCAAGNVRIAEPTHSERAVSIDLIAAALILAFVVVVVI